MISAILPISFSYADATVNSPSSKDRQAQAGTPVQAASRPPATDTVKLSTASQALAMQQSGSTVSQIAASLGLSTTQVDTELGITSGSSSTQASILAALSARH